MYLDLLLKYNLIQWLPDWKSQQQLKCMFVLFCVLAEFIQIIIDHGPKHQWTCAEVG